MGTLPCEHRRQERGSGECPEGWEPQKAESSPSEIEDRGCSAWSKGMGDLELNLSRRGWSKVRNAPQKSEDQDREQLLDVVTRRWRQGICWRGMHSSQPD